MGACQHGPPGAQGATGGHPMAAGDEPFLRCRNGHPIIKQKVLRPWQGITRGRACNKCGRGIGRGEVHWRCMEHCVYDVCNNCQEAHTKKLASGRREEAAQRNVAAAQAQAYEAAKAVVEKAETTRADATKSLAAIASLLVCLVIAPLMDICGRHALTDPELNFKYPWMVAGLANFVGWLCCLVAMRGTGPRFASGPEDPLKLAPLLGLLHGLTSGMALEIMAVPSDAGLHGAVYSLAPLMIYMIAPQFNIGTPAEQLPCFAVIAVGVGSALDTQGILSVQQSFVLMLLLGVNGLASVRWMLTQRWFCPAPLKWQEKPSPVVVASRVLPVSALLCLEFGFLKENEAYGDLITFSAPPRTFMFIALLGLGFFLVMISEIQAVQVYSAMLVGLLAATRSSIQKLQQAALARGWTLTVPEDVGLALCVVAVAYYSRRRWLAASADAGHLAVHNGYSRMEEGFNKVPSIVSGGSTAPRSQGGGPPKLTLPVTSHQARPSGQPVTDSL
eukprot:TRINITY_DN11160_c0_g1_i1.p1 TRINITY_DN11160_c0_g1~~TRINITY_DN11160_c0_g1_i1.p1  ORF type:complete len:503 (-),score=85.47 TRINITY_DN11160_c0_g1_i1:121-1629(-)